MLGKIPLSICYCPRALPFKQRVRKGLVDELERGVRGRWSASYM